MSIECKCGSKQQFRRILEIYGDKIDKLREQRKVLEGKCAGLEGKIAKMKIEKEKLKSEK